MCRCSENRAMIAASIAVARAFDGLRFSGAAVGRTQLRRDSRFGRHTPHCVRRAETAFRPRRVPERLRCCPSAGLQEDCLFVSLFLPTEEWKMSRRHALGLCALLAAVCFSLIPAESAQAGWRHRRCGGWRGCGYRSSGCASAPANCCTAQVSPGCCNVGGEVYMNAAPPAHHEAAPPAPAGHPAQLPPAPQSQPSAPPPAPQT